MERVALVMLSILAATFILVGSSYGAVLLAPYLGSIPTSWFFIITPAMILVSVLLMVRKKCHARI